MKPLTQVEVRKIKDKVLSERRDGSVIPYEHRKLNLKLAKMKLAMWEKENEYDLKRAGVYRPKANNSGINPCPYNDTQYIVDKKGRVYPDW